MEFAPVFFGGRGDATLENQEAILAQLEAIEAKTLAIENAVGDVKDDTEDIIETTTDIELKTRLITERSINVVGQMDGGIFSANVSTFVRDSGPLVIPTSTDFSATSVEVVVSEFRNLKLRPILTVLNASLTKTTSSVSLPSALVITKTPTEPYSQRQLEYSIRETTSKNARQKGNIHVIDSARNYS